MPNNALISTAMLNALWERQHTDVIDLLIPLVEEAIAKTTQINERISRERVRKILLDSLGYDDLPFAVIEQALKRLAHRGKMTSANGGFVLAASLDEDLSESEKRRADIKRRQERAGMALSDYLETHAKRRDKLDVDAALNELVCFLSQNGIHIYRNVDSFEMLPRKKGELDYHIARFILQEKNAQSVVFDDIVALVRGSFVSAALYFQASNLNVEKAGFKDTCIYFDAPVMLNILDLNLPEETNVARQTLDMLVREGAQVACFRHTVAEVRGILNAE